MAVDRKITVTSRGGMSSYDPLLEKIQSVRKIAGKKARRRAFDKLKHECYLNIDNVETPALLLYLIHMHMMISRVRENSARGACKCRGAASSDSLHHCILSCMRLVQ
jgi:hypothetical protein